LPVREFWDAGSLKNAISSELSFASENAVAFALCATSAALDPCVKPDHRGTRVLSPHTGQMTPRPSQRASAPRRLWHEVQRNFTSIARISGGKTAALASAGMGMVRVQDWHWIPPMGKSVVPERAVPQVTQKKRFVGIECNLG
jgi:hypothetical protein